MKRLKTRDAKTSASHVSRLTSSSRLTPSSRLSSSAWLSRAREVFDVEIKGLKSTRDSLGKSFVDAVNLLLATGANDGLVVVTGVGKNLHVAEKMSAIFASTGTRSIVLNPVQAMHGDLGMVSPRDVLLALSFSGESDEVLRLIPAIRRHGLKVISMTGNPRSTLAGMSDVHIEIPCGKEACPFGMAPTNSVTATLAMGDALAMVLLDEKRFSLADYAANHPAGAIGRALVLKVADIMRTGDAFATVSPKTSVMEALMAMTRAKGGSAVIVDAKGKLKGIFTDGDFRRVMSEFGSASHVSCLSSLDLPVSNFMTKSPLFVYADQYAADLLKIFERKRIDDLPVVNRKGQAVGLVDIQDLPKMKVI